MNTTEQLLPKSTCPVCGYETDAATCIDDKNAIPSEGDITLCIKCGEIMSFTKSLEAREATLDDLLRISPEGHSIIKKAQELIRRHRPAGS